MNTQKIGKVLGGALMLFPALAFAHSGGDATGFVAGMQHPVKGMDHLLAMLSVGIVSAQMGGRSIWTVPTLFVFMMVIGGVLGANGVDFPMVEFGIASSVFVLGMGIVLTHKWHLAPALIMIFVAIFGSLHGHAHGVEMPNSASPVYYSFGFVLSTATIHLIGVLIGHTLTNHQALKKGLTYVGASVAGAGLYILYGLQGG